MLSTSVIAGDVLVRHLSPSDVYSGGFDGGNDDVDGEHRLGVGEGLGALGALGLRLFGCQMPPQI